MNETYSIGLALFDFVPNFAFIIGAIYLVRIVVMERGKPCSRMVMAGSVLIILGGVLKATWKLLYAANIGDYQLLSQLQFTLVAPGFLALLVAVIMLVRKKSQKAPLLAIAAWKLPFLFIMTLASLGAQGILTFIAFKRRAVPAAIGFIVAFLGLLAMGSLASAEQTVAMQWIEESINSLGQIGFMTGSILLFQNFKKLGCSTGVNL